MASQLSQSRISRRTFLMGAAGLAVTGGIISGFSFYPKPFIYRGHTSGVTALAWSPDGSRIVSGSKDNIAQVWETFTGKHISTYTSALSSNTTTALAWSPDGKYILSTDGKRLQIWHAESGMTGFIIESRLAVNTVAWSPDGKYIAAGGFADGENGQDNQHARVWDVASQKLVYTYLGHDNEVRSLAWSPDSKRIASASGDETVQVWDATTGENVVTYHHLVVYEKYDPSRPQYDDPWAVAWSPDGKRIASGYLDGGGVQVWEAATGKRILNFGKESSAVVTLAWSPDGQRIATGYIPQVWDANTGSFIYTYGGHIYANGNNAVNTIAWSPDGRYIASASLDKTVQIWPNP